MWVPFSFLFIWKFSLIWLVWLNICQLCLNLLCCLWFILFLVYGDVNLSILLRLCYWIAAFSIEISGNNIFKFICMARNDFARYQSFLISKVLSALGWSHHKLYSCYWFKYVVLTMILFLMNAKVQLYHFLFCRST